MNKLFAIIFALVLASCVTPTDPEPATVDIIVSTPMVNVRIYNSAWEIVQEGYVERSRAVTTIQSYEDYAAEYNLKNTEDQLFIIEGEEIIPIEDSPPVDAYIVEPTTHDIMYEYLDWPRVDLVERRELWRWWTEASGGVLYVDRIPPPPIPVIDTRPAYEKYALYLIYTDTGIIQYEEHPESEQEYLERRSMYLLQESADGGTTYVISGRLYP